MQFDNNRVQELAVKLEELANNPETYETSKVIFDEIIEVVKTQDGWIQENKEGDVFGWEYKSSDVDWDLVTCSIIGKTVSYQRTSTRSDNEGDDDGVFKFKATDTGDDIVFTSDLSEGWTM